MASLASGDGEATVEALTEKVAEASLENNDADTVEAPAENGGEERRRRRKRRRKRRVKRKVVVLPIIMWN